MGDSIANTLGKKVDVEINGVKYRISPIRLGILSDAESELISRERPVKEQLEELKVLADVMPDYVRDQADKVLARQKQIPPEEVIEWVTSDIEGISWSLTEQLREDYPGKFESGELSLKIVTNSCYDAVENEMSKFNQMVSERNQASELEGPEKNPSGPTNRAQDQEQELEAKQDMASTDEEPSPI